MKTFKLFIILLFQFSAQVAISFEIGSGSRYNMDFTGQKADLNIYVVAKTQRALNIEFHMGSGSIFVRNLWQQFAFKVQERKPVSIEAGFIKSSQDEKPLRMTNEFFKQHKGLQVQDFLFSSESQLDRDFIGSELVELPAGSLTARHYRKKKGSQVIDFWISSEVKPISLVKIISKDSKLESNNYSIELSSLLKNVKATIDPKQSIRMSEKDRKRFIRD